MKRKLLFAAILIAGALGFNVNAQEDITSTYLTNADLSTENTGWTYYSDAYKYQAWRTGDASKSAAVEFYAGWGSLEHTNFKFSQTVTLPAGDYRIAVNAFYREGNGGNGTNANKAWIFAGDVKQNVYALNGMSAVSAYDAGGDDMDDAMHAFKAGAFSNAFDFSLAEETEISLGFQGVFDSMKSWCILGPVKLYKYSLDDYLVDYDAKYAEAQALVGKAMNSAVNTALTSAMVDRSSFSLSSEVTAAIATLTTAINNANNSISNYAAIKAVIDANATKVSTYLDSYGSAAYNTAAATALAAYNDGTATDGSAEISTLAAAYNTAVLATQQPANGTDMTAYITNADFDSGNTTGWTIVTPYAGNCGIQGGSRMEYWAGNATNRALASFDIYQEIANLPAGVYTISADMYNSLNGEGGDYTVFSPTCGVYGSSSNEEVALVTEEGTTLKTYTTGEVLYFRGKLRIGTKNTVTPIAARWFLFDNVKLTYARQLTQEEIDANTVPESVTLDQTNVSMRTLSAVTLTPTVLPDNANDKSVSWTSSDETVATVAGGVVTALKAGTATITAIANGADGVQTTASITVVDAAAPTFYSSEIVSGVDYYLVNAATGLYLGGANDWGTHASIIEHGVPFTATQISDGVYTLASPIWNKATDHYVTGTYVDNTATNLTITSLGNGKFTISNDDGLMSAQANNTKVEVNGDANNTTAQWYFLSKNDRDKMLAAATNENPVDATYYVKQANPGRNLSASNTAQNVNAWSNYNLVGDDTNKVGQLYHAAGDISQTIENIPNGTYTVTVQAFTSGTATFYANEQEVAVLDNSESIGAATTAANRFAAKAFTNTLTVTVTDRTLKIGLKSEDTDKWLVWDDVNLYMTSYTANTGVTANIDNSTPALDGTAQITAATDPATASFNAITYTSSDENVATVDAEGKVTAVGIGEATITVAATEMENFSTTIDITVPAPEYVIVEGAMNVDIATAQTTAQEAYDANQTTANYRALVEAIANAQASKDAYAKAAEALAKANTTLNSTKVYTAEAREAFSSAINTAQAAYDDRSMTDEVANGLENALNGGTQYKPENVPARNYVAGAWTATNGVSIYANNWSIEGNAEGSSGMTTPFIEDWVGDDSKLADTEISASLSNLENGHYIVTAFVRAMNKKTGEGETGYDGISLQVNDGSAVAFAEATEYSDGYAKVLTAEGLVKDGNLNIKFNVEGTNVSWLAIKNVNYTKDRDLTPEEMAVVPTAIALFNGEDEVTEPIVLDGATPSVTLSTVLSPEDATEGYIDWNSSDLSVATVNSLGEVTAVSTGTAIITATSKLDNTVSASVTVKSFAFLNGSFEADGKMSNSNAKLDAITGWTETVPGNQFNNTQIYDSETANASAFGTKVNPTDGTYYLFFRQGWCGSSTADMTMTTGNMTLPIGKYTISYDYMLAESTDKDHTSSGTKLTFAALDSNSETLNSATVSAAKNPGNSYFTNDANWASSSFVLTLTEETTVSFKLAMTPRGGVRSDMCVDNFRISYENIKEALPSMIADVTIPTSNVGTEAFQISSSAVITLSDAVDAAQEVYDNVETTEAQAIDAIEALENAVEAFEATPINEPADGQLFNVVLTYNGWTYDNKAMTYIAGGRTDGGNYNIQYKEAANTNLAQAFTFTKVEGNNYKMSQIDADGVARYISTGVQYGGNTGQIRTTTDVDKALVVTVIPTAIEGKWNLRNTEANQYIGSQDEGVFTVNSHIDFNIVETTKPSIDINTTVAGWGTTMLPFAVASLPEGVKAYSCAAVNGATLTLDNVSALEANKPYIIEGAWNETLTGDAQGTALNYTEGLLTGVYAATPAPEGSYVLQNNDSKVGFYLVAEGEGQQPTVGANRAYLTVPAQGGVKADAFFFDEGTATAIKSVFDGVAAGEVYDLAGRKLQKLQKGVNIVNGKKVLVK